ncbi:hypothetical protein U1Q18_004025, partial [Sarracenia purpurea var. burkii]
MIEGRSSVCNNGSPGNSTLMEGFVNVGKRRPRRAESKAWRMGYRAPPRRRRPTGGRVVVDYGGEIYGSDCAKGVDEVVE